MQRARARAGKGWVVGIRLYDFLPGGCVGARLSRQTCELRTQLTHTLCALTRELPESDRALLERYLVDGVPTSTLAAELGIARRGVTRRVHALLARANSAEYRLIARCSARMARVDARIGHALFCEGLPLREAARKLGLSVHTVREARARLCAMAGEMREGAAA